MDTLRQILDAFNHHDLDAIDRGSGREVVFYGQSTLLAAGLGGPALRLRIVRVSIDFDSEYEQLAAVCLALKGHYDDPRKRLRG